MGIIFSFIIGVIIGSMLGASGTGGYMARLAKNKKRVGHQGRWYEVSEVKESKGS
jgi:hypothetical protein